MHSQVDSNLLPASDCGSLPQSAYHAGQFLATVVEQERMARNTYRLRLRCPELARWIVPGQFFMVRPTSGSDPLLGRPFALFDTFDENGQPMGIDFGYVTVGKLTCQMPGWKTGDEVSVWGPLGRGFPVASADCKHLMCVAGGIGQTPFLAVAREALGLRRYGEPRRIIPSPPQRISLCYGARSVDYLAGLREFNIPGLDVRLATNDGSRGHRGLVTDLLEQSLKSDCPPDRIYCCGPEPMMHAVQKIAVAAGIPCWLSLETPMACGIGICFSCVAKIRQDDGAWDYRRTCIEGPIFPADKVLF